MDLISDSDEDFLIENNSIVAVSRNSKKAKLEDGPTHAIPMVNK